MARRHTTAVTLVGDVRCTWFSRHVSACLVKLKRHSGRILGRSWAHSRATKRFQIFFSIFRKQCLLETALITLEVTHDNGDVYNAACFVETASGVFRQGRVGTTLRISWSPRTGGPFPASELWRRDARLYG